MDKIDTSIKDEHSINFNILNNFIGNVEVMDIGPIKKRKYCWLCKPFSFFDLPKTGYLITFTKDNLSIKRNYDEIYILYSKLLNFFPYIPIPKLPKKDVFESIVKPNNEYFSQRLNLITFFFNLVNSNEILPKSQIFQDFVKSEELEKSYLESLHNYFDSTESSKFSLSNAQFIGFFKKLM